MKTLLQFFILFILFSTSIHARIISSKNRYYIVTNKGEVPLMSVNSMLKGKEISNIITYGNSHIISFTNIKRIKKLYSVDEKGFTYSIEPFASYTVSAIDESGKFQFKEAPGRIYTVNSKGFFLH